MRGCWEACACAQMGGVKFSIVTPSLRQLSWLKRGVRSVADQGVTVEHIVQDAGTGTELENWARAQPTVRLFVEPDSGLTKGSIRGLCARDRRHLRMVEL